MTEQDQDITQEDKTAGTGEKDGTLSVRVVDSLKQIEAATFESSSKTRLSPGSPGAVRMTPPTPPNELVSPA